MRFDFSKEFQRVLLAALLKNPEAAFSLRYTIEPTYFQSRSFTIICGALFAYVDKYKELPRPKILADKIRREIREFIDDEEKSDVELTTLKILKELYLTKLKDIDYIMDLATAFAQDAAWRKVFLDGFDYVETKNYEDLMEMCIAAQEKGNPSYPYLVDRELDGRLDRLIAVAEHGRIKTGIKHFDRHIRIFPPSFCVVIGDSGKGKTWMLLHLARAAMMQGYNVLFFTGEMPPDELGARFDGSLLGISSTYFYEKSFTNEIRDKLRIKYEKLKGELTIVQFFSGDYSVGQLETDIHKYCMRDNRPTVVIVDFMDLLIYKDSGKRGMNETEEQKMVCRRLQSITYAHDIVLWAAGTMLTKRERNKDFADRNAKAGAGDVVYSIDVYVMLNQSQRDRLQNRIILNIDKHKKGVGGWLVAVRPDFGRSRFCVKSIGAKSMLDYEASKEK